MNAHHEVRRLRILIIADARIEVPPLKYGGSERIIAHLADGFAAAGHEVVLMGHPASQIDGRVVGYRWSGNEARWKRMLSKLLFLGLFWRELRRRPDVVLASCRIDYLGPIGRRQIPLIYQFQNPMTLQQVETLRALRVANFRIVALTAAHAGPLIDEPEVQVIGNCADVERLPFTGTPSDGYLAFLGRLTRNKGVDIAIRVARRVGLPLRIAGNIAGEEGDRFFFESQIKPQLDAEIRWIGEIGDAEKGVFLGNARALLMPIRWDEPFGIVVAEALACGTPVIASPRGSMPELIQPGRNGFLAPDEDEFVAAIQRIPEIDRAECRSDAVKRFSRSIMVGRYLELIYDMVQDSV